MKAQLQNMIPDIYDYNTNITSGYNKSSNVLSP